MKLRKPRGATGSNRSVSNPLGELSEPWKKTVGWGSFPGWCCWIFQDNLRSYFPSAVFSVVCADGEGRFRDCGKGAFGASIHRFTKTSGN